MRQVFDRAKSHLVTFCFMQGVWVACAYANLRIEEAWSGASVAVH